MNDDSSNVQKWTCEYCTYANYPSALKCTMCRGSKPLLNEDIFRLREESPSPVGDLSPVSGPSVRNRDGKWSCHVCTYLNGQTAKECAECSNIKLTASDLHEHLKPLRIEQTNEASSGPNKWSCLICTYENWPKATRCVMCGAAPRISPSTISLEGATKENEIHSHFERGSSKIEESNITASLKRSSSRRMDDCSGGAPPRSPPNNLEYERRMRLHRHADWPWLNACLGVVQGDHLPVEAFLSSGGDPTRQLTASEVSLLNRPSAFDVGYTLVHLAIRFHREDLLATLLSRIEGSGSGVKRVPSYVAPDLAADIRRHAASIHRQRKASLPIPFLAEWSTFTLPAEIEDLPPSVQEQLFEELLDKDAQQQLEADPPVINWSLEITVHLGSRLYALWNSLPVNWETTNIGARLKFHLKLIQKIINLTQMEEQSHKSSSDSGDASEQPEWLDIILKKLDSNKTYFSEQLESHKKEVFKKIDEQNDRLVNAQLEFGKRLQTALNDQRALFQNEMEKSAGDCLLDSLMQATWGVFDRDNLLRRMLSDSLNQAGHVFYPRWREYESCQARLMHFSLEETQWEEDWSGLVSLASQPGNSLEQLHVFALAHILRRPIIVYGVKYVKSFRGEDLGYARFEGVYLPLLWDSSFCIRSPLSLGYTRGHFSALVPIEPYSSPDTGAPSPDSLQVTFLPLMDHDRKLLPVHFVTQSEMGSEENLLRQWLDVCVTDGGLLVAQQRLQKRPLLVAQMLEEWLNHYRRLAQMSIAPFSRTIPVQDYSSDGDTDDE